MVTVTGKEYLHRISKLKTEIWLEGSLLQGPVTEHPAFKAVLQSKAKLYDLVHEKQYEDILSAKDHQSNFSYEPMKTKEDLEKHRLATQVWANQNAGLLGRSPEYGNTIITTLANAKDYFAMEGSEYGERIERIHKEALEHDLTFTHTFVNPKARKRSSFFSEEEELPIAAKIVDETDEGIVIDGARLLATQGGITDEVIVLPAGFEKDSLFAFSIPSATPGLKFLARPSYATDSLYDEPYSSQFEEGDAIVVFDNVLVPWDRVFLYKSERLSQGLFFETGLEPALLFHASNRQIVKTEWLIGLAEEMVETLKISQFQHIQQKLAEMITALEAMRAFVYSSEAQAGVNEYGMMVPFAPPLKAAVSYYQTTYPRLVEIIQLIGASNFIAAPNEKDFQSPIAPLLERFIGGYDTSAKEKVQLLRLAKDLTMGDFGSRQTQFERYFYGDPVRLSTNLYNHYDTRPYRDRVKTFLETLRKNDNSQAPIN
ncbi:4-hydroxyphenylacetate 3-hydroxylase family protein [Geomicrobium sediminis]|uniref:4-hydroxyphenylacetate 3-monooxygenase n=1 Tax=Geomicrobium sediminis TaxID=1347788 RepID=A0ABS2P7B8_9BACL|nr:4-hydroxyphenylacetate 3-hydroxylase N-terminal domain-containing protein [Geomicrobium sediminis]MBM7631199.1 4-hydroxyphenylacetate 3-monooxygenase [Geomicrobium sediminis]